MLFADREPAFNLSDSPKKEVAHMQNQGLNPGRLMEMSGQYWQSCALQAAVKLDLFAAIGDSPRTAQQVANEAGLKPRAAAMLLNAMAALGLIRKDEEKYANTRVSIELLCPASPKYIGHMIMHHHHLVESWGRLDEAVRSGQPVRKRTSENDDTRRESFLMGMFNIASATAPMVVPHIDLSTKTHLLDLGGGPGTWAIHFCQNHPQLKATVWDLPTTRPFAEKTIARFELTDRIQFSAGDYSTDDLGSGYDVAWLSHILHAESPWSCRQLLDKTASALAPGGWLLIHEFILNDNMDGPLFPALFSLNMLLGTNGGQSYAQSELAEMLISAGATKVQRIAMQLPNDSGVMMGQF